QHRLRMQETIVHGLPHPDPTAPVSPFPPGALPQAIERLMKGGDDPRPAADPHPREDLSPVHTIEAAGLVEQARGMGHHVPRQEGADAVREAPGAELREGVVMALGSDDVVTRLRAPVVPDHQARAGAPHQRIGHQALSGVAEPEVTDHEGAWTRMAHHARRPWAATGSGARLIRGAPSPGFRSA